MNRPTDIETLMSMAEVVSRRSTCDRLHVGAVIVRNGRVISTGYNGNVSGAAHCRHSENPTSVCTTAVHAEANAIVFAARHGVATQTAELFTTHQPCEACAKLIVNAGIMQVYFMHPYRLREGLDLLLSVGWLEVYRVNPEDYSLYQVTR